MPMRAEFWTAVHVLRKPCPFYVTPSWRYFL